MKKILIVVFAIFLVSFYSNAVQISGQTDDNYKGKQVFLFTIADAFSEDWVLLDQTKINADGSFELDASIDETRLLIIHCDFVNFNFFATPGKNYNVFLSEIPDRIPRSYTNYVDMPIAFTQLPESDINSLIASFNTKLDSLISKHFDVEITQVLGNPFTKEYFASLNAFYNQEIKYAQETKNRFYEDYVHFSIADQFLNSRIKDDKFFEKFLTRESFNIHHPIFSSVYIRFFSNLIQRIDRFSETPTLSQLLLEDAPSDKAFKEEFMKLDFLKNNTLRSIASSFAISEVYNQNKFNTKGMLNLLKFLSASEITEEGRQVASNFYKKFIRFEKGSPIANINLSDSNGKIIKLKNEIKNPTLLFYWAKWSTEASKELALLKSIKDHWEEKINIIVVSVDSKTQSPEVSILMPESQSVKWYFSNGNPSTRFSHQILSIPKISFVDGHGRYIKEWMQLPSKGLEKEIQSFMNRGL